MYFLAEFYVPSTGADPGAVSRRAATAAGSLELEGSRVQFLRAVFVPSDEIGFALYRASTPDAVANAGERAGLRFDRIREAVPTSDDTAHLERSGT
jgi:hypothetical protein